MIDPHSFREFEHSGWQGIPQQYHQAFGELTTQSIEPLLDAAGVKAGTRVIDIASGPRLRGRGCRKTRRNGYRV